MRLRQFLNSFLPLACLVALSGCGGASPTPQRAQSTPPAATPAPSVAASPNARRELDVPYVPTPEAVVEKMLQMAKVDKDDLLYDLGSGDGRIVITAARKYGARGVGYDIDPQRIEESNENARRAGVSDRVRFVRGDLFEADLSAATVVTLYLLPDVNMRLRPKLLSELKPGTLVVSHNYGMGDWEPAEVFEMEAGGSTHYVYSWVVPAR